MRSQAATRIPTLVCPTGRAPHTVREGWLGSSSETYEYDVYGNMTAYNGTPIPIAETGGVPNNRLAAGSYNDRGSLTSHDGFTFVWDALDQLRGMTSSTLHRSFAYDAAGERVFIREDAQDRFTLRGLDAEGSSRDNWSTDARRGVRLARRDDEAVVGLPRGGATQPDGMHRRAEWSGCPVTSPELLREVRRSLGQLTWEKDLVWRGGVLLATVGAEEGITHVHVDHLGSTRLLTDRCGQAVATFDLYPFGKTLGDSPQHPQRMRFTGHERDLNARNDDTDDFDYMHARYYSPGVLRFFSVDPERRKPVSPQGWNRFSYGRNNPVRLIDPDGRDGLEFSDYLWIARETVSNTLDRIGFIIAKPMLRISVGILNDDLGELAKGTGEIVALSALGAAGEVAARGATCGWTSRANMLQHAARHGEQVGMRIAESYGWAARDFVRNTSQSGLETVVLKNGNRYMFHKASGQFAVTNAAGDIVTYFLTNTRYWKSLLKRNRDLAVEVTRVP